MVWFDGAFYCFDELFISIVTPTGLAELQEIIMHNTPYSFGQGLREEWLTNSQISISV